MCAAAHFTSDTTRVLVYIQFVILNCICPSYDFFFSYVLAQYRSCTLQILFYSFFNEYSKQDRRVSFAILFYCYFFFINNEQ